MTTPPLPPLPEWDAAQRIDRDARTPIQEFVYCNEPSDIVPGSEAQFRDQLQSALQEAYQAGRDAGLEEAVQAVCDVTCPCCCSEEQQATAEECADAIRALKSDTKGGV